MVKRVIAKLPLYQSAVLKTPAQALKTVTSKEKKGVYASSDTLFRGAIFGRDSLEVAEDLLRIKPKLVKSILLTLGSLQGEVNRNTNEEEPGKIIHEYRRTVVDGKPLDDASMMIFKQLAAHWGGNDDELAYYGSIDSTPHFIRVLGGYCKLYGRKILAEKVVLRSGESITIDEVAQRALSWLEKNLNISKSGLLEYRRRNKSGIQNQVWKDSNEFYVHSSGTLADHNKPIASIEVQALAYDGLQHGGWLFPKKARRLDNMSDALRKRTFELLWQPEWEYFALGTDYDENDNIRIIKTVTANPADMLESGFFQGLSLSERRKYVGGIVKMIMSDEFLTDAGIRSRGLSEARLIKYWDYHGSYTTWPKETSDIANGLRWQGFNRLAIELENRLVNVVRALRSYPEFIYVDRRGRVLGAAASPHHHAEVTLVESTNNPERVQAWTVSAVIKIATIRSRTTLLSKRRLKLSRHGHWQDEVEKDVISHMPLMPKLRSNKELSARYPAYPYTVKYTRKLFEQ